MPLANRLNVGSFFKNSKALQFAVSTKASASFSTPFEVIQARLRTDIASGPVQSHRFALCRKIIRWSRVPRGARVAIDSTILRSAAFLAA
jgi:hypothetical protein